MGTHITYFYVTDAFEIERSWTSTYDWFPVIYLIYKGVIPLSIGTSRKKRMGKVVRKHKMDSYIVG